MKEVYVISIIGFIYSVILAFVTFLFFRDYTLWAILGSATALFNHSIMIQITTKSKFSTQRYVFHLMQRYVFYFILILFVYLETKDLPGNTMIYSYIFMLLGIFSIKFGILVYHMPFIKKPVEVTKEEEHHDDHLGVS